MRLVRRLAFGVPLLLLPAAIFIASPSSADAPRERPMRGWDPEQFLREHGRDIPSCGAWYQDGDTEPYIVMHFSFPTGLTDAERLATLPGPDEHLTFRPCATPEPAE